MMRKFSLLLHNTRPKLPVSVCLPGALLMMVGHVDVTQCVLICTLGNRVKEVTSQVIAVGALHMAYQRTLGMVCSEYLPTGLHGCEGSAISVTALSAFRSAVARAVWSKKLPMTDTPALLSLPDSPWGSDPAFFVIWSRFFFPMRRFLACRPEEEGRICRMMDCASTESQGMTPFTCLFLLRWRLVFLGLGTKRLDSSWSSSLAHDCWSNPAFSENFSPVLASLSCHCPL